MIRPSIVAVVALVLAASHARADEKAPSYVKDIRPFLNKYCVECHKTGQKKGGANLESYESIKKGGKNGRALLVAGKPNESRIVTCTEGTSKPVMPPKKAKAKPGDKEVAMLRAWVAAGAKDDTPADTRLQIDAGNVLLATKEEMPPSCSAVKKGVVYPPCLTPYVTKSRFGRYDTEIRVEPSNTEVLFLQRIKPTNPSPLP